MRTRVLVTDGKNTIQVYWVEHTGSDIYFGMSGIKGKRSYHASGKQHSSYFGKKQDGGTGIPLKDIKRVRPLTNLLVGDLTAQLKIRGKTQKFSGRKSDNVLLLDARAFPHGAECHVEVGLLEPGMLSALQCRVKTFQIESRSMVTLQIVITTSQTPWVYALAKKLDPKPTNPQLNRTRPTTAHASK